jgi:hypothetical protein
MRKSATTSVEEFALDFTIWIQETHPKIFFDLLAAYNGNKGEEE